MLDWQEYGGPFKAEASPPLSTTPGRLLGILDCFSLSMFFYTGSDLVAMAAHESEFQRRDLPKAVRRVSTRLILYYSTILFILGLTVSSSDPILSLQTTPTNGTTPPYPGGFVVMAERAGLPGFSTFINIIQITATFSVVMGDLYIVVLCLPSSTVYQECQMASG